MNPEEWNRRYRAVDLVWGTEPNRFVAEALGSCRPDGRALDLACGEGRNAIWLAKRGWVVTAVDYSEVAIQRGRRLAKEEGVQVEWICGDVTKVELERGAFGLVLVSYLQVPTEELRAALARSAAALPPGGRLFMIGHALRNRAEGIGGPSPPEVLWEPRALESELRAVGLEIARCEEVSRAVETEGGTRAAIDVLADAHRPAA